METNFDIIKKRDELLSSESAGSTYQEYFESGLESLYPSYDTEVLGLLKNIQFENPQLTNYQNLILVELFGAFDYIKRVIDPERLKGFKHLLTEDMELVLFRRTEHGLTNLVIDSEEGIAYSYIGEANKKKVLEFYNQDADFEDIAFSFFSN
jgi:hypothetical protein